MPRIKTHSFWARVVWILGLSRWLNGKESSCQWGDASLMLGWRRSPGKGHGCPLQYSCLGSSRDRGAWWATVHGVSRVGHNLATKQQQVWTLGRNCLPMGRGFRASALQAGDGLRCLLTDPRLYSTSPTHLPGAWLQLPSSELRLLSNHWMQSKGLMKTLSFFFFF